MKKFDSYITFIFYFFSILSILTHKERGEKVLKELIVVYIQNDLNYILIVREKLFKYWMSLLITLKNTY